MTTRLHAVLATLTITAALVPLAASAQTVVVNDPPTAATSAPEPPRTSTPADSASTRIVSDPLYLPMKGQVFGSSGYTFSRPTGQNFRAGAETSTFTADDHAFDQAFAYGLTNRLTARIAFGYGVNERDSTADATGDVTVGNARGFTDPTFSVTYRLVDEPSSPIIFDLSGVYSPDLLTAQASGGVGEGTLGRGGQNAGLAAAFGRVTEGFTLAGTVSTTYVGEQTTEQLSNGTSTSADGHWSYALGVQTQTRFTPRTSVDVGFSAGSAASYSILNTNNGNTHTYAPPVTRTLNLAFNYHFSPNRFVGAVTYAYDNNTDATNTFVKATSNTAVKNRTGNTIGVRFLYVFN